MTMITIRLVLVDGQLHGQTFSDAWNLANLLYETGVDSIKYHKNGAGLRKIRAANKGMFKFVVDTKGSLQDMTTAENNAMSGYVAVAA
jgi:hypothetical protein